MAAMLNVFYAVIIFPIEQVIEAAYTVVYKIFETPGLSILGVSFVVTFLCLPLYILAEKWQDVERRTQKILAPKIDKIKSCFTGDQRYLILSTYYRQNRYHPVYALRASFGALVQIPFFIAAYHFLSHLETLNGARFLFIKDLSAPDALFHIGNTAINILPLLMTAINCAAGMLYTHKRGARDKIQVYGIALVFLAMLYKSPSGIVLYWTMNNILSFIKNIFYKLKNPLKPFYATVVIFTLLFIAYLWFFTNGMLTKRLILSAAMSLIFFIPLFLKLCTALERVLSPLKQKTKECHFLFFSSCITLAVLAGLAIPSSAIASSPQEFSFIDSTDSPFVYIFNTFFKAAGILLFWMPCLYLLFGKKIKTLLAYAFCVIAVCALFNSFVFTSNYSAISNTFTFDSLSRLSSPQIIFVLGIVSPLFICAALAYSINRNKTRVLNAVMGISLVSLTTFSVYNAAGVHAGFSKAARAKNADESSITAAIKPIFSLSKEKPNIIVIMSDGAISGFVKPVFDEHPALYEQFDGFTLYPNTVSFSTHTIMAAPPIWGGYEYTPKEMNARSDVPLVKKHNEALLVLPAILTENVGGGGGS
jgi:YidC/Oxa1 family membrane protein insertase